jgi:hypothetical protein
MKSDRSGMRLKVAVSALLLVGLCGSAVWADGGYNYGPGGYQRVYSGQLRQNSAYPQYFPRIEPESSYQSQPAYQPQYAAPRYSSEYATPAARPQKALSTKIADGFNDLWKSPSVKSGIAGAGIGLGAAALTKHALWRGSLMGAGYGIGVGLMDESVFFKRHPFVRRTAKGAVIGLGAAAVTGAAALAPAAAVGAGVGAGIHYLKMH